MTCLAIVEGTVSKEGPAAPAESKPEISSSLRDVGLHQMRLTACLLALTFPHLAVTGWLVTG